MGDGEFTITCELTDLHSETQRFSVGISGKWPIESSKLGRPLVKDEKAGYWTFSESGGKKGAELVFRWNARQILGKVGKPLDQNFQKASGYFKFSPEPDNAVVPTGCKLAVKSDRARRLVVVKRKHVRMSKRGAKDNGDIWTLEPGLME